MNIINKIQNLQSWQRFLVFFGIFLFLVSPQIIDLIAIIKVPTRDSTSELISGYVELLRPFSNDNQNTIKYRDSILINITDCENKISVLFDKNDRDDFLIATSNLKTAVYGLDSTDISKQRLQLSILRLKDTLHELAIVKLNKSTKVNSKDFNDIDYIHVLIALVAVIIAAWASSENNRVERLKENYKASNETFDMFLKDSSLLKFHGITKKKLKKYSLTSNEFIFLLKNFNAISSYYTLRGNQNIKFSTYRKEFLDSPKVKVAWVNLIRNRFISFDNIVNAIDEHYCIK